MHLHTAALFQYSLRHLDWYWILLRRSRALACLKNYDQTDWTSGTIWGQVRSSFFSILCHACLSKVCVKWSIWLPTFFHALVDVEVINSVWPALMIKITTIFITLLNPPAFVLIWLIHSNVTPGPRPIRKT